MVYFPSQVSVCIALERIIKDSISLLETWVVLQLSFLCSSNCLTHLIINRTLYVFWNRPGKFSIIVACCTVWWILGQYLEKAFVRGICVLVYC